MWQDGSKNIFFFIRGGEFLAMFANPMCLILGYIRLHPFYSHRLTKWSMFLPVVALTESTTVQCLLATSAFLDIRVLRMTEAARLSLRCIYTQPASAEEDKVEVLNYFELLFSVSVWGYYLTM